MQIAALVDAVQRLRAATPARQIAPYESFPSIASSTDFRLPRRRS
jgi:hypothetical protein